MLLVEHQALASSTGVPWCGRPRLPLGAPPASRPAHATCADWASIASDWVVSFRDWAAVKLRPCGSALPGSQPSAARPCRSPRTVLSRAICPPASIQRDNTSWSLGRASGSRIPRYGQVDRSRKPSFTQKARRFWRNSLVDYYIRKKSSRWKSASVRVCNAY